MRRVKKESDVDQKRTESLGRLIPDLFNYKTVLYIGARNKRIDYGNIFVDKKYEITVLEAFKPNIKCLRKIKWIKEVIHADVTVFETDKKYDIVFWWHGPEHVDKSKLESTIKRLEALANVAVVMGCPWGNVLQSDKDSNPYERHVSCLDRGDFEKIGYLVEYIEPKDVIGSNITAVKYVKENL